MNVEKRKCATYIRVSTQRQGLSGLGMEAQREVCKQYIASIGGEHVNEFMDIESGKSKSRYGLLDALEHCKTTGDKLVIAKLDRLARDVEFTFHVVNQNIDIYICDMPEVNTITLGVLASFAQHEREQISQRTKAGLAAKKATRGYIVTSEVATERVTRGWEKRKKNLQVERDKWDIQYKNSELVKAIKSRIEHAIMYEGTLSIDLEILAFDLNRNKVGRPLDGKFYREWNKYIVKPHYKKVCQIYMNEFNSLLEEFKNRSFIK